MKENELLLAMTSQILNNSSIYSIIIVSILIKQRGICLLACLSGMAGHALNGMAPCFGHTGVTFDAENDRPDPGSLQGHFEAA